MPRLLARSALVAPDSRSKLTKRELDGLGLLADGLDQAAQAVALAHREHLFDEPLHRRPARAR